MKININRIKSFAWGFGAILVCNVLNHTIIHPEDMHQVFVVGCAISFIVGYGTGTWDTKQYSAPDDEEPDRPRIYLP